MNYFPPVLKLLHKHHKFWLIFFIKIKFQTRPCITGIIFSIICIKFTIHQKPNNFKRFHKFASKEMRQQEKKFPWWNFALFSKLTLRLSFPSNFVCFSFYLFTFLPFSSFDEKACFVVGLIAKARAKKNCLVYNPQIKDIKPFMHLSIDMNNFVVCCLHTTTIYVCLS